MGLADAAQSCFATTICFLVGVFIFFPGGLVLTGWNEKRTVCRTWAIETAASTAKIADCGNANSLSPGDLGFLACPVNASTLPVWTHSNSFVGLDQLDGLFGNGVPAAALKMTVKYWQCKETCSREECRNRRLSSEKQPEGDDENEPRFLADERKVPGRRLGKGGGGHQDSCQQVCVAWSYSRVLSEEKILPLDGSFHWQAQAEAACGTPLFPPTPYVTSDDRHAISGQISTSPSNGWHINGEQVQMLPIDAPVSLSPRPVSGFGFTDSQSPAQLTLSNTFVTSNTIDTCQGNAMGCLVISFMKSVPQRVAMLGEVASGGEFATTEWDAQGYWLCKGDATTGIKRFCPSVPGLSQKGWQSCGEDITTLPQLVQNMKDANQLAQWAIRAAGFLILFIACNCFFLPIKNCLGFITDMMDDGTDCIPCVGSCVDCLTDIFMGMVRCILHIVSCCCAAGWFLTVVVIMWVVMRPVVGGILAVVACCFCAGAGGMLYAFKGGGKETYSDGGQSEDEGNWE